MVVGPMSVAEFAIDTVGAGGPPGAPKALCGRAQSTARTMVATPRRLMPIAIYLHRTRSCTRMHSDVLPAGKRTDASFWCDTSHRVLARAFVQWLRRVGV